MKPANPGGLEIADGDESILSGAVIGHEAMAPPPETPAPQVLKAEEAKAAQPVPTPGEDASVAQTVSLAPGVPPAPPPVTAAPEQRAPAVAAPPAARTTAPVAASPSTGGAQVQLAALSSEGAALSEWQRLAHKMPELLSSRRPAISRTEHDGRVFFRLRTGGFADIAQATSFCQHVREKGGGCSIASF